MDLFQQLTKEGLAIIIATHDLAQARYGERILELKDGRIIAEHSPETIVRLRG